MTGLFLILSLLIVLGVLPAFPASRKWAFMPSGALGLVVLVMVLMLLLPFVSS